ncbi:CmpA/NrtA family ABC transporter substrate-binding protein [Azospirillum sp.]|uniref:CmpA/NrtA family ABC transporter substrate-binding protein n=1 Tax=Azospirillum sp. TaxID=34012 RepID=UPI002D681100|nr:CmpA/NrtA family ABC transporter substrate-binding protein [Azospirillum sp.]HYD67819.1 CmpA/NrtA family ABC transporter substrate-binding protein [Azospirillum sp.]
MGNGSAGKGTRRGVLAAGASIAAAVALAGSVGGALAAPAGAGEGLEKSALTLGFVPLTDCAPLVVAKEKGFFRREGLDVTLSREPSWANIRDKVAVGLLDGAHMLAGIPLAATAGIDPLGTPMIAASTLDLGGNAITVSADLHARMLAADPEAMDEKPLTARALKAVIEEERIAGRPRLSFGVVFSVASHAYQLRWWLAEAGIDPDADVRLVVVPPPRMVASLAAGEIVGFCVGEPWNTLAVHEGIGRVLVSSHELWNNGPEKVFGVTEAWARANPNTLRAVVRALIRAARWLEEPGSRLEAASILASGRYIGVPAATLVQSLINPDAPDFVVFHRYAATFPWRSHAVWTLAQMVRWGQLPATADLAGIAARTTRADLYRKAAVEVGEAVPLDDMKVEGIHDDRWVLMAATNPILMGPDRLFDGRRFDPERPLDYVNSFPLRSTLPEPALTS